ncbi:MAG TPA: ParB/RepB/Spo0J family partition protein [Candidatus Magasanikbacteria bacterium]|nr:ParB/RepB/Spo0J family partition protein [Candidatus Magasanikbacteria bacterium]
MSLGRGLGALISANNNQKKEVATAPVILKPADVVVSEKEKNDVKKELKNESGNIWFVPVSKITGNPDQPRKNFKAEPLNELAESIKKHGVLQPLILSEKIDGNYEIIAGERRWRASKIAGLATVPAIIKQYKDQEKLEIALIENVQRADLNPLEEAFAYRRLVEEFDLTQEEVADRVGKSRSAVANTLRLLDLPEQIKESLVEGKINTGQARALLSLPSDKERLDMLASMLGKKITVRELERETQKVRIKKIPIKRDANLLFLEEKLRESLGTKVSITARGESGSINISYYSKDELAQLIRKITGLE